MRALLSRATLELIAGASAILGVALAEQLQDPYSSVRLRLGELADRLREVNP